MKKYIFETTATMKEYNNKKWWIDSNIVGEIRIAFENFVYDVACQRLRGEGWSKRYGFTEDEAKKLEEYGFKMKEW